MMRTQKDIEKENKMLFEKMETCTLLMGNAIVTGNDENYELCLIARQEIKNKIEDNLDEMDDTVKSFHYKITTAKKRDQLLKTI
jgi:hypothetical protein